MDEFAFCRFLTQKELQILDIPPSSPLTMDMKMDKILYNPAVFFNIIQKGRGGGAGGQAKVKNMVLNWNLSKTT